MKIARRFNAGTMPKIFRSPEGTIERSDIPPGHELSVKTGSPEPFSKPVGCGISGKASVVPSPASKEAVAIRIYRNWVRTFPSGAWDEASIHPKTSP
jgi:hypothetical protein